MTGRTYGFLHGYKQAGFYSDNVELPLGKGLDALSRSGAWVSDNILAPIRQEAVYQSQQYVKDMAPTLQNEKDKIISDDIPRALDEAKQGLAKDLKPYAYGAVGLAIGLPLLLIGVSVADRILIHKRLKDIQKNTDPHKGFRDA